MADSQVSEWLDENALRAFPLRETKGREVVIRGLGRASVGVFNGLQGGYALNGNNAANFLAQITPGDFIEINGIRSRVVTPNYKTAFSSKTLYLATALPSSANAEYNIVKKNFSLDASDSVNFRFSGLFLDANISYHNSSPGQALLGKLDKVEVVGSNLEVTVLGIPKFILVDYNDAEYPAYVRNSEGSLIVLGAVARHVKTNISFVNQFFESSVLSVFNTPWKGVTSLQFNEELVEAVSIEFKSGYQLELISTGPSSIRVSTGKLFGRALGCEKLMLEDLPQDCGEVVFRINGSGPEANLGNIEIVPGPYLQVFPDVDRHRIYIGLTFNPTDICVTPHT